MQKTITGIDMKVFFGFRNIYLKSFNVTDAVTEKQKLVDSYTWFDAGTVTQIRFASERSVTPKYTLTSLNPQGAGRGVSFTQGDMIFKNFNKDSVNALLERIVLNQIVTNQGLVPTSGLSVEAKRAIEAFDLTSGSFATLSDEDVNEIAKDIGLTSFLTKGDNKDEISNYAGVISNWDEVPMFDIRIVSKSPDNSELSFMEIRDVKVTDVGTAESIDSTEINDIVKFMAIGGSTPWSKF